MRRRDPRQSDRGVTAVLVAVLLLMLCTVAAVVVNIGFVMSARGELQNASDSAALAAAGSLNGKAAGLALAREKAEQFSLKHGAVGQNVTISGAADVTFGRWHFRPEECTWGGAHPCFEPYPGTITDKDVTAVRVTNGRDGQGAHNAPIPTLMGGLLGRDFLKVVSAAIAVGGGQGMVDCALPFAVDQCQLYQPNGDLKCEAGKVEALVFKNDKDDTIGLADPTGKNHPNPPWAADFIRNKTCVAGGYSVGDALLQNGNDMNHQIIDAIRGVDNKGNVVGGCLIGRKDLGIAVVDAGCAKFNQNRPIVGWTGVEILAVQDEHGTLLGCPGQPAPVIDLPAPDKGKDHRGVVLKFLCTAPPGSSAGGAPVSSSGAKIRLVH